MHRCSYIHLTVRVELNLINDGDGAYEEAQLLGAVQSS